MSEVKAKEVAALRKLTGAGMMDCKRALEATEGDIEAAKTWLREKGLVAAQKRAGRTAEQGAVEVLYEGGSGAVVELTCETDFVAKGTTFASTLAALARQVLDEGAQGIADRPFAGDPVRTVGEEVQGLAGRLGENIALGRAVRLSGDGLVEGYKHVQNHRGTIGVLVELSGVAPDDGKARGAAHDIAMHIASEAPRWVRREEVPGDVVLAERQVLENLTRNEGKPEAAIGKIVEGRLGGFYRANVLMEQPFVRDPKVIVGSLVSSLGPEASLRGFVRLRVGEE